MNKKTVFSVGTSVLVSTFILAGVAVAATPSAIPGVFDSLTVGKQGVGGVTFFNGTIVNSTTENGNDNPVTFGDNVRIDGRVYRGATSGSGDSQPFIVNDDAEVVGSLSVSGVDISSGFISVPAASFTEASTSYDFTRTLNSLVPGDGASTNYSAGISLPHGATVTSFKGVFSDSSAGQEVILVLSGPSGEMARVESVGTPGIGVSAEDTTISNAVVDNESGSYGITAALPGSTSHELREVIVGYSL